MSVIVDETVRVIVAVFDCPGVKVVPSLFQVTVIGPFAFVGVQLVVVRPRDRVTPVPVFFTYTVRVTVVPGLGLPQSNVERPGLLMRLLLLGS
jgi:hypothetical protein